jgi:CDP-glycerol glycerophosphotransferase (TagB/SpsB family)
LTDPQDYTEGGSDNFAVTGDYFKDVLLKKYPDYIDRIFVTGQPRYDIFATEKINSLEIRRRLNLELDKKIILFASTHFQDSNVRIDSAPLAFSQYYLWLKEIYTALDKLEGFTIVVKPHHNPNDSVQIHKEIIDGLNASYKFNIFSPNCEVIDLISACDVFVTFGSTTALEAALLRKPMVIVNLGGVDDPAPYLKEGIAIIVYKQEDILPTIKMILEDQETQLRLKNNQSKILEHLLYKIDGKAAKRVAELMEKLCGVNMKP